ncbi:hypothetical protein [Streptomyces sp. NPDC052114]|uniref:FAS1-like dehydratase domain-containing protein n=1 Tax=unclassified Streptomyces TaxID=2593676 RepID=UPI00341325EC
MGHTPSRRGKGLAAYLDAWNPDPVTTVDVLRAEPLAAFGALLDVPDVPAGAGPPDAPVAGGHLPPLWHWLYFLDWPAQRDLGTDGHPAHGSFLPPVPDRRRMIAGGRAEFTAPLTVGAEARRTTGLAKTEVKHGRTGEMVFVTVRHEIIQEGRVRVVEEQDVVYRSGEDTRRRGRFGCDTGDAPEAAEPWQLVLRPSPSLLFRFSALTANAHRIHYDTPYCKDVEGYPGLVVHGPLLVLLMLQAARAHAPGRTVRGLSYRLHQPLFAGEQLLALGGPDGERGAELRVASRRDERHASARVTFA